MEADYANIYGRLYREHWWWRARERLVLETLRTCAGTQTHSILDIGCGSGWAFDQWEQFGTVQGLEIDPTLVDRAGERRSQIHLGPLDASFEPHQQYSIILMLDVLEHLEYPVAALRRVNQLLKPEGTVIVTVPALPWLWTSHDVINHHYIRYTRKTLRETAMAAEMELRSCSYFFHWLVLAKWIVRCREFVVPTKPKPPTIPPRWLNELLLRGSLAEQRYLTFKLPLYGTSLLAILRKFDHSHARTSDR